MEGLRTAVPLEDAGEVVLLLDENGVITRASGNVDKLLGYAAGELIGRHTAVLRPTGAHRILSAEGYTVIHAATASEALRLCSEYDGHLDLVLTDVFLTDWRGQELAEHLRRQYPDLKVMLMSGDPSASPLGEGRMLLRKPFTKRQLVDGVREVLLGAAPPGLASGGIASVAV